MAFEFKENLTLYVPQIDEQVKTFTESATTDTKKLVIELAAIHEGLTSNYNNYPAKALEASLATWVQPYPKPIILNHDPESEAVGRVMAARMDTEEDGSPYIRLQVGVTSPDAIAKCLSERYLTGSVGGKADSAKCSICSVDWAQPKETPGMPCKHQRGKIYNGKLASLELDGLSWKEYSFVNIPADQKSSFRNISLGASEESTDETDGGWIRAVSFFSVDMNKESIVELSESAAPRDVLSGMKKKDAHAIYLNVKGTFLSASAHDFIENTEEKSLIDESHTTINNESGEEMPTTQNPAEENDMSQATDTTVAEEEDDILAVTDALSADLASTEEITEAETTEEAPEATETPEVAEAPEDEEKEEEEKPEEAESTEEQLAETETSAPVEQANETEDTSSSTETTEAETPEGVEVLTEKVEKLQEENAKLRKALHNVLAERVVDAKIAVGILESDERAEAVAEHSTRTASSLADSLRDLKNIPSVMPKREFNAEMTTKLAATGNDGEHSEIVGESATVTESAPPEKLLEDIIVDGLMGRRSIYRR